MLKEASPKLCSYSTDIDGGSRFAVMPAVQWFSELSNPTTSIPLGIWH